jgi:hypothetical protein
MLGSLNDITVDIDEDLKEDNKNEDDNALKIDAEGFGEYRKLKPTPGLHGHGLNHLFLLLFYYFV